MKIVYTIDNEERHLTVDVSKVRALEKTLYDSYDKLDFEILYEDDKSILRTANDTARLCDDLQDLSKAISNQNNSVGEA